ncbi:MAG TPA: hypothetical protein VEF05_16615 [Terriglobales bacterium]|nr:hypothetical protein [Terriglobales bacterium]
MSSQEIVVMMKSSPEEIWFVTGALEPGLLLTDRVALRQCRSLLNTYDL